MTKYKSKTEQIVAEILTELDIEFIYSTHMNISGHNFEIDFIIESRRLVIEVDGIQHFAHNHSRVSSRVVDSELAKRDEFIKQMEYDRIKDAHFIEKGWKPVLRIPHTICKKDDIKRLISNALGWVVDLSGITSIVSRYTSVCSLPSHIDVPLHNPNGTNINVSIPINDVNVNISTMISDVMSRPPSVIDITSEQSSDCKIKLGNIDILDKSTALQIKLDVLHRTITITTIE